MKIRVNYFFWIISLALGLILLICLAQVLTNKNTTGLQKGNQDAAITFTIQNSLQEIVNIAFTIENRLIDNKKITLEETKGIKDSLTLIGFNSSVLARLKSDPESQHLFNRLKNHVSKEVTIGLNLVGAVNNNNNTTYAVYSDSIRSLHLSDSVYLTAVKISKQLETKLESTLEQNTKNSNNLSAYNKALALIAIAAILILATIIINRHLWQLKLIRDLERANIQVQKSSLIKDQFVANMSHEIRTPLNAMKGFSGLMLQTDMNKVQTEYANIIHQACNNLLEIVNDVLDISKIEAGHAILEKKQFNLYDILYSVEQMFAISAKQKGVEYAWLLDAKTPVILVGDPEKLNQILVNLVSNAIKFTYTGKIVLTVGEVQRSDGTSHIRFSIEDTGIGIREEKLDKIFERFYQINNDASTLQKGTGLGLSIVKHLVTLMHGEISVQSKLGKGSVFTISIPFEINENSPKIPVKEYAYTPGLQFKEVKLLVAEDNNVNQLLIKHFLKKYTIDPEFTNNGAETIERLQQESFDLLLLDIQMPVMNGYETIEKIRKMNNQIPVVAMTAYVMPGEKEKCMAAGMNGYLPKPINEIALQQVLIDFLKNKKVNSIPVSEPFAEDYFLNLVGGNRKMAQKILTEVKAELGNAVEKMNDYSANGSSNDQLRTFCHHLVSTISPLGVDIPALIKLKQLQHELTDNSNDKNVEQLLDELKDELVILQEELMI